MGRRYVEIMLQGREETRRTFEVDGRRPLGAVVREYLQTVAPEYANGQIQIMADTPSSERTVVDENITVDDFIRNYGTDRIRIVPNAIWA